MLFFFCLSRFFVYSLRFSSAFFLFYRYCAAALTHKTQHNNHNNRNHRRNNHNPSPQEWSEAEDSSLLRGAWLLGFGADPFKQFKSHPLLFERWKRLAAQQKERMTPTTVAGAKQKKRVDNQQEQEEAGRSNSKSSRARAKDTEKRKADNKKNDPNQNKKAKSGDSKNKTNDDDDDDERTENNNHTASSATTAAKSSEENNYPLKVSSLNKRFKGCCSVLAKALRKHLTDLHRQKIKLQQQQQKAGRLLSLLSPVFRLVFVHVSVSCFCLVADF